jgi:hypothetical protein
LFESDSFVAVSGRGNGSEAAGVAKLEKRFVGDGRGAMVFADAMLEVNRELFIGLESLTGISEYAFPKFARKLEITFALCDAGEGAFCGAIGLGWQSAVDGLLVKDACAACVSALFADARDPEKLEGIGAVRFGIFKERENTAGETRQAAQVHLIVVKNRQQGSGRSATEVIEIKLRN